MPPSSGHLALVAMLVVGATSQLRVVAAPAAPAAPAQMTLQATSCDLECREGPWCLTLRSPAKGSTSRFSYFGVTSATITPVVGSARYTRLPTMADRYRRAAAT